MSISGKKDGNNWNDVLLTLSIGIAIIVFGLSIFSDRLYYDYIHGFIDFSNYHTLIGVGAVAIGVVYLFVALKNYLTEE
jgi:hypothetical protein